MHLILTSVCKTAVASTLVVGTEVAIVGRIKTGCAVMESKDKLELMRTTVLAFASSSAALRMWVTCKRSWYPLSELHTYLVQDPEEFTNNVNAQQQTCELPESSEHKNGLSLAS